MKIMHLSKKMAFENINRLMEIDKIILDEPWMADNFLMELNGKWEHSLVALENANIVGFAICSMKGENLHIHRIAVSPKYQRKKIGAALIKQLVIDCYDSGIRSITLKVNISNLDAHRFYEKLGFKKIASYGSRYLYERVINDKQAKT